MEGEMQAKILSVHLAACSAGLRNRRHGGLCTISARWGSRQGEQEGKFERDHSRAWHGSHRSGGERAIFLRMRFGVGVRRGFLSGVVNLCSGWTFWRGKVFAKRGLRGRG